MVTITTHKLTDAPNSIRCDSRHSVGSKNRTFKDDPNEFREGHPMLRRLDLKGQKRFFAHANAPKLSRHLSESVAHTGAGQEGVNIDAWAHAAIRTLWRRAACAGASELLLVARNLL